MRKQAVTQLADGDYRCPSCKKFFRYHQPVGHTDLPKDGDVSICAGCGEPLAFTDNGTRQANDEERALLASMLQYGKKSIREIIKEMQP